MKFKNNASKYGFYFGQFCGYLGTIILLLSLPFICSDFGDFPINISGCIVALIGTILNRYGVWRTGGIINAENYEDD
jgi:hypothetical protein